MTPGARVAAAIEVLDRIAGGMPAEQALTNWARGNRYAGSKDRAAIRDHVFDALRRRSSLAMLGGGTTGRALMIGAVRAAEEDPSSVFTGAGYAPAPLEGEELVYAPPPEEDWPDAVRLDYPKWLDGQLRGSLGPDFEPVLQALRARAPVFLRTNVGRVDRATAAAALLEDGIQTAPHPLAETALEVTSNARAIRRAKAYTEGLVELQDAASQAVVEALGPPVGLGQALDYCAGGGGKALALAALGWSVSAHDIDPVRMRDIPARAARAGSHVKLVESPIARQEAYDLVLVDAPCSGSGAWRRQAEARWTLTHRRLEDLQQLQDRVLGEAAGHVTTGGRLAYATCSLLRAENEARTASFLERCPEWHCLSERRFSPLEGGDGFYLAILERRRHNSTLG